MKRRSFICASISCWWCEAPFTTDRLDVVFCSMRCGRLWRNRTETGHWIPRAERAS